ncbi:putative polyketide synthase [Talaromyces proteolyticus]|uniref:Polyketide synthase n=1 Tax=Talaromyces proteolyticus TaxID=1131652 RepID=A0AAD4KSF9_9EURO|nr:putative polyketide synthase [Talaromyces proteolyticus]KAH8698372.1 putative polyketide synthase [Talaromyces proteolyticus]
MAVDEARWAQDIAVVGMACRFADDADSFPKFWDFICKARSAYSENQDRWNPDAFHYPGKKINTSLPRGAHFFKQDIATFDANFFNISKVEAESIDPQQRMAMETTFEAMENAGISTDKLSGTSTGVWMANFTSDYREMLFRDSETAPMYTLSGASNTSTSNRISWFFDFKGPSFTLNTACSSSLVATHLACQSLSLGESSTAIIGGTSLLLNPDLFLYLSNQNFLSPDGKSKAFDASGDGYGRGEGVAVIMLKRVADAIADGDPIRAVIRGTSSNQDGRTKGMTLPSADAQEQLIQTAYRNAGLSMAETRYVEAHGTGTQAGDKTETEALSRTFSPHRTFSEPLILGSVKANIGHLEACAGLASIIKCVGILETGLIPANPCYKNGNPGIKWREWNLHVPTTLMRWPTKGLRRVSTQGFGYGGTNAHVILDDAYHYLESRALTGSHNTKLLAGLSTKPRLPNGVPNGVGSRGKDSHSRIFHFSAQDNDGLGRTRQAVSQYLKTRSKELKEAHDSEDEYLRNLAYTLSERRSRLQWQTSTVASSIEELIESLQTKPWPNPEIRATSKFPRVGFVFTGQGAQWPRMGVELMEYDIFRESVEKSDHYLLAELDCPWSAIEEIAKPDSSSNLGLASYSQALCSVLQIALVDLLNSWNISPCAVVGHSSGEIAAAYCLGVLSHEDALKAAYFRGSLSAEMKENDSSLRGSMMAVGAKPTEVEKWLEKVTKGDVVIACVNSPTSVTLSGDTEGIEELEPMLNEAGVFARKLKVDTAYHSPHMQIIAGQYFEAIADITTMPAKKGCRMHSSVQGALIDPNELGAANWVRNLVSTVQFADAVHDLLRPLTNGERATENAVDILVEVGPHSALQGPVSQTMKNYGISGVNYCSVLSRKKNAINTALSCAATLYSEGLSVDIRTANRDSNYTAKPLVDLPSYPWNHSAQYWAESRVSKEYRLRKHSRMPLVGAPAPSMGGDKIWRGLIRPAEEPWVRDHVIQSTVLYPAAGFLTMAIEAARQNAEPGKQVSGFRLRDVSIDAALVIDDDVEPEVVLRFQPHRMGTLDAGSISWHEFTVSSSTDGKELRQNCSGLLAIEYKPAEGSSMQIERIKEIESIKERSIKAKEQCETYLDVGEFYSHLDSVGLTYGATFANLTEIHTDAIAGLGTGRLLIPDIESAIPPYMSERPHIIHPTVLDAIFHLAFAAISDHPRSFKGAMVPTSIAEVLVSNDIPFHKGESLQGFAQSTRHGFRELITDINVFDENFNDAVVQIRRFRCADVSGGGDAGDSTEGNSVKPITFRTVQRPSLDLLAPEELRKILISSSSDTIDQTLKQSTLDLIKETLIKCLLLLHHVQPELSILEIVDSTSRSITGSLLPQLNCADDILETSNYTVSVKNEKVAGAVADQLGVFKDRVNVEVNALDKDERSEGGQLDLILMFNTVLDNPSFQTLLENAKKQLKEGGRICIIELGQPSLHLGLTLATLHQTEDDHEFQLVIGKSPKPASSSIPEEIVIVEAPQATNSAQKLASHLAEELGRQSIRVNRLEWTSKNYISSIEGRSCIVLADLEKAHLLQASPDEFRIIQETILKAGSILWISGSIGPDAALVTGLARTVRNEVPGSEIRVLQINNTPLDSVSAWSKPILRLLQSTTADTEFTLEGGVFHITRIVEDRTRNEDLAIALGRQEPKLTQTSLSEIPGPVKLSIKNPGMLDSLYFEPDYTPETDLPAGQIEVDVKASGVNFRDVMVCMGQIPDSLLGFEGAGIVRRVGDNITNLQVGDRVCFLAHGSHRTIHRVPGEYAVRIPDEMSFEEASGVLFVHGTAWYGLVKIAQIKAGQTILIHAAAGGVGQAAVMLAQHYGLEVYATVGSQDKKQLIQDLYNIPDDHIFNSRDLSFVKGVLRMTDGLGVDVILNSLSGEALRQTWHCIAPFGTFIEIGIKDILGNTRLDMRPFLQDARFAFFNFNRVEKERPKLMSEALKETMALISSGATKPVSPLKKFPISQVEEAFRLMQTGKHRGKLSLSYSPTDVVPFLGEAARPVRLNPSAAYVLVGGLGGLGRSLAQHFVQLGCKKLCFLSRSGGAGEKAQELLKNLQQQGVETLALPCDVSDSQSVTRAIEQCTTSLGPIRGVVQCAMLLRDGLFEKMSHQQWIESTRPKVQGSWNLHQSLPHVDFFIILSSFAGIFGSRGQSNYTAAGAYEDALASYRRSLGLKAITLDLGIMRDVGVLAEQGITDYLREWEEPCGIREVEFHALMDNVLAGELFGDQGSLPANIPTGLATEKTVQISGISKPFYFDDARFSILATAGALQDTTGSGDTSGSGKTASVQTQIAQVTSVAEAASVVTGALVARVAKSLQSSVSDIDPSRPLHVFGVDSLVAVEVVNWVFKEIKAKVTVFDILASVPITSLAEKVALKSSLLPQFT